MSPNPSNTRLTGTTNEILQNLRGAAQLTFDVCELLLDARQSAMLVGVRSARQMLGQAPFLDSGFELVNMIMDREYAFERDVIVRVRRALDPNDPSAAGSALVQPFGPATGATVVDPNANPASIHLTAHQGAGEVSVSLQLQNHLPQAETIALTASPFSLPGSSQPLSGKINFDPATMEIPAKGSGAAKVVISLTPDFLAGFDYVAEIVVQATHGTRIPLVMTILPPENAAPAPPPPPPPPPAGNVKPPQG